MAADLLAVMAHIAQSSQDGALSSGQLQIRTMPTTEQWLRFINERSGRASPCQTVPAAAEASCSTSHDLGLIQAKVTTELQRRIHQQAYQLKWQHHTEVILQDQELHHILQCLERHASYGEDSLPRINYDGFSQAAAECAAALGPQAGRYLSASLFLRFACDGEGAIPLPLYAQYLTQHCNVLRLRAQLALYDEGASGYLTAAQLEAYLADMASATPGLNAMEPGFLRHYVRIASRKLLFFHGKRSSLRGCRHKQVVVRLGELVVSPVMGELQELRGLLLEAEDQEQLPDLSNNWFSLASTQRVYSTFDTWDSDCSGSLSRAEFSRISQGTMSELFISRVFEEHVTQHRQDVWPPPPTPPKPPAAAAAGQQAQGASGSPSSRSSSPSRSPLGPLPPLQPSRGNAASSSSSTPNPPENSSSSGKRRDEMDMMEFVDFVLAWDHRSHPAALHYLFAIFDLQHRGYLTASDLYTFFKEIHLMWVAMGEYADLSIHDVLDEIMDMVQPAVQGVIRPGDLAASKMAGTVFSILANVDQFYQYNYRENFMHQEEESS